MNKRNDTKRILKNYIDFSRRLIFIALLYELVQFGQKFYF